MRTLTFVVCSLLLVVGGFAMCPANHRGIKAYPKHVMVDSHSKHKNAARMPTRKDTKAPKGRFHDTPSTIHHHDDKANTYHDVHDDHDDHYADIFGHVYSKDGKAKKSDSVDVVDVPHDDHFDEHIIEPCFDCADHHDDDHLGLNDDFYVIHEDIHDDYDVVHKSHHKTAPRKSDPEDCCRCPCRKQQKYRKVCWDDFEDDDSLP